MIEVQDDSGCVVWQSEMIRFRVKESSAQPLGTHVRGQRSGGAQCTIDGLRVLGSVGLCEKG